MQFGEPGFDSTGVAGGGSTAVDASLTSAGSTRLVGRVNLDSAVAQGTAASSAAPWFVGITNPTTQVTVSNPTTSVSLSSQATVTVGNPTTAVTVSSGVILAAGSSANTVGAVAQGAGSTSIAPWYVISTAAAGAGSTTVDANLTSAGSTKLAGRFTVENPTTSVTLSSGPTVVQGEGSTTVAPWYVISTAAAGAGSTTVDANLSSAGSTRLVGQVTVANPTTAVTVSSGVVLGGGSTANMIGTVTLSTINQNVDLSSAGSTRVIGLVDGISFSSAGAAFTSLASSVDVSMLAANANRKGCIIQNHTTATAVLVRMSTQVVSSASSYQFQVPANGFVVMGGQVGNIPNFTGPMRCKANSTAVASVVYVTEFT